MFHSDRGNQYTSADFRKLLDEFNVIQSFSAKGCPFDNAVVESFFKFFKTEETNRKYYSSLADLNVLIRQSIFFPLMILKLNFFLLSDFLSTLLTIIQLSNNYNRFWTFSTLSRA